MIILLRLMCFVDLIVLLITYLFIDLFQNGQEEEYDNLVADLCHMTEPNFPEFNPSSDNDKFGGNADNDKDGIAGLRYN